MTLLEIAKEYVKHNSYPAIEYEVNIIKKLITALETREQVTTLRDEFAMAALTGLLAKDYPEELLANKAYKIADAMLEERKGKE